MFELPNSDGIEPLKLLSVILISLDHPNCQVQMVSNHLNRFDLILMLLIDLNSQSLWYRTTEIIILTLKFLKIKDQQLEYTIMNYHLI